MCRIQILFCSDLICVAQYLLYFNLTTHYIVRNILLLNEFYSENIAYVFCITDKAGGSELIEQTTSLIVTEGIWIPPSGWNGPSAALYRSFDISDGLVLMEGYVLMSNVTLVAGKVK